MNAHRTRPFRVLYLIHWLNRGGIECSLLSALRRIDRRRWKVDVGYKGPHAGELADAVRETGAELHHCPLGPTVIPFIQRLKRVLVEGQYDLLHAHIDPHAGPAVVAARAANVPVVTSFHNTTHPPETRFTRQRLIRALRSIYMKRSMRYAVIHSDLVTGVSRAVVDAVEDLVGVRRDDSRVLYSGIVEPRTLTADQKAVYRAELGLSERSPVVLHVGSFTERKNHMGLLEVFRRIVDRLPDATLLLVGDGLLRPAIEGRIQALGLSERVKLLGTRDNVTDIMQVSSVLVFPSITEGLGWVLVEAGATRLPIVASDIPPIREATDNGASARLHDVADVEGMAASAVELLHNAEECRRRAELGHEIYRRTFSVEASVERLITLYDDVLRNGRDDTVAAATRPAVHSPAAIRC